MSSANCKMMIHCICIGPCRYPVLSLVASLYHSVKRFFAFSGERGKGKLHHTLVQYSQLTLLQTIALELGTVGSPQHVERETRAESARLELLGVP